MVNHRSIGDVVSLDYAFDNGMRDDDEEIAIYRSAKESHAILMTVWRKDDEVAHTFSYVIEDDDSITTQDSALDPDDLIDELPEMHREDARDAVTKWSEANDTQTTEPRA